MGDENEIFQLRRNVCSIDRVARVTNAVAEGINSIIQSAKRRARGYRTLESCKCMIYLVAGEIVK